MARLRVRMELNRGGVGVPLAKLAHVVDEAQKFFRMLGEDVHIDEDSGEWLGFDFDHKSLNFTAEFVGPVAIEQVREFHAAFDGVTQLRRATIAQFARIADAIEEDELIGFGLYQNDQETQPSEWRSLSRREALRITEEIRLLLDRAGDSGAGSRIPAALDPSAAASLFRERREHGARERGIEALTQRVDRLENEVTGHTEAISNLRGTTVNTEQNLQKLLVAVDTFCDKASRQIERLPAMESKETQPVRWPVWASVAAVCAIGAVLLFRGITQAPDSADRGQVERSPATGVQKTAPGPAPATPPPAAPAPVTPPPKAAETAPAGGQQRIELKAIEPTWAAIYVDDKLTFANLIEANQTKIVESAGTIRVRLGNAGGVEIFANGKPVGAIGRSGQVRMIEFTAGGFRVAPLASATK